MSRYTDNLWSDLVREHAATLADSERPAVRARRGAGLLRRPRVLAGSSLGLAGVAAGLVLALSGTAATAPAFAITRDGDGSVTVHLGDGSSLVQINQKLAQMNIDESVGIAMGSGPATVSGAVQCTTAPGEPSSSGPAIKVLDGRDGTEVIASGNTGAGTYHLKSCGIYPGGTSIDTLRGYGFEGS